MQTIEINTQLIGMTTSYRQIISVDERMHEGSYVIQIVKDEENTK